MGLPLLWMILLVLFRAHVEAFVSTAGGCTLTWEETPPPQVPLQFYLYARRAGESYRFAIRQPTGGHAVASAENRVGSVEQQLPCARVVLAGEGRHYLVVTAVALERQEETTPSNEIWLDVRGGVMVAHGQVTEETPDPMPVPHPPKVPVVQSPPVTPKGPMATPPPSAFIVKRPPTPMPPGGGSSLAASCIWQSCTPSAWPRTLPPGFGQGSSSLEGSTIWHGTP